MDVSRSTEVIVLIGTGAIGQAIAGRIAPGKNLLLADVRESTAKAASDALSAVEYQFSTHLVDMSSREAVHALATAAADLGDIK
jgi:saccharopine dehydrogenase-like NADP-dependent oxidoreductase